jgi:hypothetical protein
MHWPCRGPVWRPRIVQLQPPEPLVTWCEQRGVTDAITGGYYKEAGSRAAR